MNSELATPQLDASGRRIAVNSLLNLSTGALLLILNILVIPLVLRSYGLELFGILSVTWMILSNLSWLDLGLSRATAVFAARELGAGDRWGAAHWTRVSARTLLVVGFFCALLVVWSAPILVRELKVSPDQREQVITALRIFALAMPIDFAGRGLVGALQASQRFRWLNGNDLVTGIFTVAVYGIGSLMAWSFLALTLGLLAIRVLAFGINLAGVIHVLPEIVAKRSGERPYWESIRRMAQFGFWLSLAAFVGALLLYFDRWLIGIQLGVALLPFYSLPMSVLIRLHLVPSSISSTFFPAVSSLIAQGRSQVIEDYWIRSNRFIAMTVIPLIGLIFVWTPEILAVWIGHDFASRAALVMQIVALGFGFTLMAPLAAAVTESAGRPDVIGKIYLALLPFNILIVYGLVTWFGLTGAAFSFLLRAFIETAIIWVLLYRCADFLGSQSAKRIGADILKIAAITTIAGIAVAISQTIFLKVMISILAVAVIGPFTYKFVLDKADRVEIQRALAKVFRRKNVHA